MKSKINNQSFASPYIAASGLTVFLRTIIMSLIILFPVFYSSNGSLVSSKVLNLNFTSRTIMKKTNLTYGIKKGSKATRLRITANEEPRRPISLDFEQQNIFELAIGSEKQFFNILFDTGSYVLWVPIRSVVSNIILRHSYHFGLSNTLKISTEKELIKYGSGSIEGFKGFETVSIGEFTITDFEMLFVNYIYFNGGGDKGFDGILGVGNYDAYSNESTAISFIENLYRQKQINKRVFSITFYNQKQGTISIGDLPAEIVNYINQNNLTNIKQNITNSNVNNNKEKNITNITNSVYHAHNARSNNSINSGNSMFYNISSYCESDNYYNSNKSSRTNQTRAFAKLTNKTFLNSNLLRRKNENDYYNNNITNNSITISTNHYENHDINDIHDDSNEIKYKIQTKQEKNYAKCKIDNTIIYKKGYKFWTCEVLGVSLIHKAKSQRVSGKVITEEKKTTAFIKTAAIFDSGASTIFFPESVFESLIINNFLKLKFEQKLCYEDASRIIVCFPFMDISDLPDQIVLKFASFNAVILKEDLFQRVYENGRLFSFFMIRSSSAIDYNDYFLIGLPFLKAFTTVFDWENQEMGFYGENIIFANNYEEYRKHYLLIWIIILVIIIVLTLLVLFVLIIKKLRTQSHQE